MFQKVIYLWIGRNCNPVFLSQVLGVPSSAAVPDNLVGQPPVASFTLLQLSFSLPFTPFLPATDDNEKLPPPHSICSRSWTLPSRREPELSLAG